MKLSIMALSGQKPAKWESVGPGGSEGSGIGVDTHKHLLKVFRLYFTVIDKHRSEFQTLESLLIPPFRDLTKMEIQATSSGKAVRQREKAQERFKLPSSLLSLSLHT